MHCEMQKKMTLKKPHPQPFSKGEGGFITDSNYNSVICLKVPELNDNHGHLYD